MRSTGWIAGVALLAAAAGCGRDDAGPERRGAAQAPPEGTAAPMGELPQGITAEQGAEGRTLYQAACVMCHGEQGEGTQLGPALASGEWARGGGAFEEIVAVVTEGASATDEYGVPMPPRGNGRMSDEEIRAVSAYAYSLSRGRTAPAADTVVAGE
jgi:mono/diheme cytochrome c family protein